MPRILILYTEIKKTPYLENVELYQIELIKSCLECIGWNVFVGIYHPRKIEVVLHKTKPDVVFNLAYGYSSLSEHLDENQPDVVQRLEKLGCYCIGSRADVQYTAQDKKLTAEILKTYEIESPNFVDPTYLSSERPFAVLKPRFGAGHMNVQLLSRDQLRNGKYTHKKDFILQEYISGNEYTIGIFEDPDTNKLVPLVPIHISFHDPDNPFPMMIKGNLKYSFVAEPKNDFGLMSLTQKIFKILKFRDYGRFDFRIGINGPVLLDANTLPGLNPRSLFAIGLNASGYSYQKFIWFMAKMALYRKQHE